MMSIIKKTSITFLKKMSMLFKTSFSRRCLILYNSRDIDDVVLYEFFDPAVTFKLNADFESYVGSRLRKGNLNHIYFMPHNHK